MMKKRVKATMKKLRSASPRAAAARVMRSRSRSPRASANRSDDEPLDIVKILEASRAQRTDALWDVVLEFLRTAPAQTTSHVEAMYRDAPAAGLAALELLAELQKLGAPITLEVLEEQRVR